MLSKKSFASIMKFRLRGSYLFCGLCLATGLLVVSGKSNLFVQDEKFPDAALIIATTREPETLHPVFGVGGMATVEVLGALFEPLTVYDDLHILRPCLAEAIPTTENGGIRILPEKEARDLGAAMESIWHLRPDARWSDGTPVLADDFIFTYELIKNPDVPAVSRELEDRIAVMKSRDGGRTLVVLWKRPYAYAHEGHRHLVIPRHIEEPWLNALADKREYERTPFNRQPVGNGPYRVATWSFGRYLVLERNAFWHGPEPALSRIIYRFIPEGETVLANLDTGRLGAVSPVALDHDLGLEYEQRMRERKDTLYQIDHRPGLWWQHIDFNTENRLTSDKRLRQALAAGLNRKAICKMLLDGNAKPAGTWLPPHHPAADVPGLPLYDYDPIRAGRLLEAAGWHQEMDGLRYREGQKLQLTLRYAAGELLSDRIAQMTKEDWRQIGIDLNLRPEDPRKFEENSAENRAYQGLSLYPWIMDPSADGITFWTSDNIPTDENPTGQNFCRWQNTRSDRLLRQATETLNQEKRTELLWEQQRIWSDELPAISLFFQEEVSIHHRDLKRWRPTGTDTPVTWNCHEWQWLRR